MYALLVRIEQRGLVDVEKVPSEKGPPRKVYSLNAAGRDYLDEFWRTEFADLWERQKVAHRFADHEVLIHPEVGAIEVDCQVLYTDDRGQAPLVLTPAPGSADEEKIRLLSVVGAQDLHAEGR